LHLVQTVIGQTRSHAHGLFECRALQKIGELIAPRSDGLHSRIVEYFIDVRRVEFRIPQRHQDGCVTGDNLAQYLDWHTRHMQTGQGGRSHTMDSEDALPWLPGVVAFSNDADG
jgi:hypothetical protein